jgi:hypothetical protein
MKTPTNKKKFIKPPQCQHTKANGLQCGSPALRDHRFCYFHQRTRDLHHLRRRRPEMRLYIPLLEDANAVQIAIQQVAEAIVEERIDPKRAGLLLFAFQTAACNLKNTDFEPQKLREEMGELSEPLNPFIESLARELGLILPGMEPDDDDLAPAIAKPETLDPKKPPTPTASPESATAASAG